MASIQTAEKVKKKFKKEGVELSLEEIGILGEAINKSLEKGGIPLSEEELYDIAGGSAAKATSFRSGLFEGVFGHAQGPLRIMGGIQKKTKIS